jgi:outer membrane receptor for ferrienterochelin and colicins
MGKWHLALGSMIILQAIYISALAQSNCGETSIDSAEYKYGIGRFDESIDGLTKCLNEKHGFNSDQKIEAYHLLAKCYLAIDSTSRADSVIEELLLLKDNFETDAKDEERFRSRILFIRSNIVSSVSKRSEDLRRAPATAVVITAEEILQRGYTDLIDILKDIPGFDISIYYGQLYANVYQRGFRTDNTEKILLLFDGVEENDLWSNFADISQQYPLTNIKRVEVIYGPASTMYGPNAYSGVINVITKQPADYLKDKRLIGINANTGIGSYNTRYIDVSGAFKKGIFSFSGTCRFYYSDRPDLSRQNEWNFDPTVYDDNSYMFHYRYLNAIDSVKQYLQTYGLPYTRNPLYRVKSDTSQIAITDTAETLAAQLNKALFDRSKDPSGFTKFINPAQALYISSKINIGDLGLGFVSWSKEEGIGTTFTDFTASVSKSRWIPAHNYIYLNYNKRINEKLIFTSFLNYRIHTIKNGSKITSVRSYSRWGGLELKDLYNAIPSTWLTTYYYEQSEQFRSEFKLVYNQSKYFYLLSGVELRNSQLQGYYLTSTSSSVPEDYGFTPDSIQGGNQYNVNDIGIYTQGSYRSKKGFGITLGGRLDYNQIKHGGGFGLNLSPRFVVDYEKKGWIFKAIVSKGIQNVSNFAKFNEVNVIPNPSLKTELIYNYEISASGKITDDITADIDFYYSSVKDVFGTIQVNHKLQSANIGEYNIKGIQSTLYFKSQNKKWQASLNYSYTDPKRTLGTDTVGNIVKETVSVADIALHKVNAIVNFNFLKNFNISIRANYVGRKRAGPGTNVTLNRIHTFDAYVTENMALSVQNLIKGTTIQFICNNMFDKTYYSPGIRSAGGVRYPNSILQMGRNFFIKINFEL